MRAYGAGLDYARKAGSVLLDVKHRLQHGEFLPWVGEHTQLSARTAQGYMRLTREWPRLVESGNAQRVADLPLRKALALLADPRPPLPERYPVEPSEIDWRARAAAMEEAWEALEADLDAAGRAVAHPVKILEEAAVLFHEATKLEGHGFSKRRRMRRSQPRRGTRWKKCCATRWPRLTTWR